MSQDHIRVQHVARLINGFPFSSEDFSYSAGMPLVRIRDLQASKPSTFVDPTLVPSEVVIGKGDIVIGMDGDFNSVLWDREPSAMNQRVCLLRARDGHDPRFIAYALPEKLRAINEVTYSTTVKHLSSWDVEHMWIPRLSLGAQCAVANYLDRETAKIDALINVQRALATTLQERRESIIAVATTRGLRADPGHGPENVGWLSDVPDRWSVKRLSRLAKLKTGGTPEGGGASLDNVSEGIPWITPEGLGDGCVPTKIIDGATIASSTVMHTTVVLVCTIGATLGSVGISAGPVTSNQQITMVDFAGNTRFFYYQILAARRVIRSLASGNTLPILNNAALKQLRLAAPPLEEQQEIVEYLDREIDRIDTLIAKCQRMVELSQERRSALIAAAVTGQIDVAGMESDEEAA